LYQNWSPFMAKDCYFNKSTRIVKCCNAKVFLLNNMKAESFDEIRRAFLFQK